MKNIYHKVAAGFLIVVCCFLSSCATQPTIETTSSQLFPLGVYEQRITLRPEDPKKNPQAFRGILSLAQDKIQVVGLSPFGNTVFNIQEDRVTQKVKTEIYHQKLKALEDRIKEYYSVVRSILMAPRAGDWSQGITVERRDSQGRPLRVILPIAEGNRILLFKKYDDAGIPKELSFDTEGYWVSILVKSYQLKQ